MGLVGCAPASLDGNAASLVSDWCGRRRTDTAGAITAVSQPLRIARVSGRLTTLPGGRVKAAIACKC